MFYVRLCTRASVHWRAVTAKHVNTRRRHLWLSAATSSSATAWSWWAAGARRGRKYSSFCQKKKQADAVTPSRTVKGDGGSGVPVARTYCSQRPHLLLLYDDRVRLYGQHWRRQQRGSEQRHQLRPQPFCGSFSRYIFLCCRLQSRHPGAFGYCRCWLLSPSFLTLSPCLVWTWSWHCWPAVAARLYSGLAGGLVPLSGPATPPSCGDIHRRRR